MERSRARTGGTAERLRPSKGGKPLDRRRRIRGNGHETKVIQERNPEPIGCCATEVVPMNQQELTQVVDEALERFRGRDLVASAEVVDVLLDLRLLLLEVESL